MAIPRSEYPRPQFERESWSCLNGEWEFTFDPGNSGEERGFFDPAAKFDRKITVPFCPESELSGIGEKDFLHSVWYRKAVTLTGEQLKGRVLLHFGAVDYLCTAAVNGTVCGKHEGGYGSFCFEITDLLHAGANVLTVHAEDEPRSGKQPRGKQSASYYSRGCDYTRTIGIWQTAWLEFVPAEYLKEVRTVTDFRNGSVSFSATVDGRAKASSILTKISLEGKPVAETEVTASGPVTQYSVTLKDVRLWEPGSPSLYDVEYILKDGDRVIDRVKSYFGFRTVELKGRFVLLNGKPIFQRLILDQGFYPDGIYTAPTDEALKRDIELSQALGFNGARLHQKIFEERYLYWADRLGYLVWGEDASWGLDLSSPEAAYHFLPEWIDTVKRDFNHPSLIGWCPFNETWDYEHRRQDNRVLDLVYRVTKAMDPTRPVIDTSGNFHVSTDLYDVHDYEQDPKAFAERYGAVTETEIFETYPDRQHYEGQPYFVSEYGGIRWPQNEGGWGYGKSPESEQEVAERYAGLTRALTSNPYICGFCYTQLYDVEQEQNGLYTYGREPKFSKETYEVIRKANLTPAAAEKKKF